MIDESFSKVTLDSVPIMQEFLDVFFEDLPGLPLNRELELELNCCRVQLPSLYHLIGWHQLN